MKKYYTRACNFYYGNHSRTLVRKKKTLPLNGNKSISFDYEILENKLLGDLRKNEMNFMKIWNNKDTAETKDFIKKTNCNCTYECALTYNILGNWRYQPRLISSLFKSY